MDDAEFAERVGRLVAAIDRATGILEQYGEAARVAWLSADRDRIISGDRYGLDHLLRAFGGMGSLTDVAQGKRDGDRGDELGRLTSAVYADARALQRELDRRST